MLEYLARFPRRFARRYCLTRNTIRYVIEYRCIVGLLSKSDHPFRRLIDMGAGSGEMSARLVEQRFAKTAIAIVSHRSEPSLCIECRNPKLTPGAQRVTACR